MTTNDHSNTPPPAPLAYPPSCADEAGRQTPWSRRRFLASSLAAGGALFAGGAARAAAPAQAHAGKALISITLDLEMSRNFPRWEDTFWDYEKGNLNDDTKRYVVEASRRVRARGGIIHHFVVGRVFEQENVDWLKEVAAAGHPIGNHTYDHVYVLATKPEDIQFRFKRAPWLLAGRTPADVIRDNIEQTTVALKQRLGVEQAGFRTPGGFDNGLGGREDVQRLLLELGYKWISCQAPKVELGEPGGTPGKAVFDEIVRAQARAQPFVYPTGLIDVPMSPISDVAAFRNARWKLEHFLTAIRVGVEWAIENRAVYDFLAHPSVLYPSDPNFRAIDLICDLVERAGNRAAIVDLGTQATRARPLTARG